MGVKYNQFRSKKIGGFLATIDYREEFAREEINQNGWMIWPPIRYSYETVNNNYPNRKTEGGECLGFPSPPYWLSSGVYCDADDTAKMAQYQALGNRNWLGTDDQGRDVFSTILYGMRISLFQKPVSYSSPSNCTQVVPLRTISITLSSRTQPGPTASTHSSRARTVHIKVFISLHLIPID